MSVSLLAAWSVILGLSCMLVGGLVLWAYGTRRGTISVASIGPEAEATRDFHARLVRWFFYYGIGMMILGAGLLFWGKMVFA